MSGGNRLEFIIDLNSLIKYPVSEDRASCTSLVFKDIIKHTCLWLDIQGVGRNCDDGPRGEMPGGHELASGVVGK